MTRRKQPRKKAAELKLVEEDRPDTEVAEKARIRTFTAVYKARILAEVDAARPGTVASILRWEGLYSSHLTKWRGEQERKLSKKRGREADALAAENKRLKAENARLEKRLWQANGLIELQKKVADFACLRETRRLASIVMSLDALSAITRW